MLRVVQLYYTVASSQLLAAQIAPRTKVALQSRQFSHGGTQSAAPATKSAHGGSQSAAPATKSSLQETSENSNPNGRTIPRMIRDRLAPVVPQTLTCQLRSHRFH